jgi:hypothetical protein
MHQAQQQRLNVDAFGERRGGPIIPAQRLCCIAIKAPRGPIGGLMPPARRRSDSAGYVWHAADLTSGDHSILRQVSPA